MFGVSQKSKFLQISRTAWVVGGIAIAISLVLSAISLCFLDEFIAPLFLNSRIERINETNLPKASVECGSIIYCRMKADDFRFSLPTGAIATNIILSSGGFDTVHGSVEAIFAPSHQITPSEYENWISQKIQVGGTISASFISNGLLIKFDYFGDR